MADQVERKPLKEQLKDRMQISFESAGIPPMSAKLMVTEAVDNYYAGIRDPHSEVVAYEAAQVFVSTISPIAANFRQAWVDVVSALAPAYKAAMEAVEMMAKAHQVAVSDVVSAPEISVDLGDGRGFQLLAGIDPESVRLSFGPPDAEPSKHPDDVITGAPHHCIVNGHHDGCACDGHTTSCEVWHDAEWAHAPSLCEVPRTNCRHHPKHTYGRKCDHETTRTVPE